MNSMLATAAGITVDLEPLPPLAELEPQWFDLERRAQGSYFISWGWIGVWLRSLPSAFSPQLLRIQAQGRTVGLAVLVARHLLNRRALPLLGFSVHATGHAVYDALMIEYNDILWDASLDAHTRKCVMALILQHVPGDQLQMPGVDVRCGWLDAALEGVLQESQERVSRGVDLRAVRESGDYLTLLRANTRTRIRQSQRLAQEIGTLRVVVANDVAQAQVMYADLCKLHAQVWQARGQAGAFANDYLRDFHWKLISNRLGSGEIQLASVRAGDVLVGVVYSLVFRGHVYNYQTGFDYSVGGPQFKPGLLAHACMVSYNALQGNDYYDFMAGDSQYKRSLGTHAGSMLWLTYQRDCWRVRLVSRLRKIRRGVRSWRSARRGAIASVKSAANVYSD